MSLVLVLGSPQEPMISDVHLELERRGQRSVLIDSDDLVRNVTLALHLGDGGPFRGFIELQDGTQIDLDDVHGIYQRVGFSTPPLEGYTEAEAAYAHMAAVSAANLMLDTIPARVVNRPVYSGSNASKPYQIARIEEYGFLVPRTLVTNEPEAALQFYEECESGSIYKSISYVRSIVQPMTDDDLERLESVRVCPVQLQERVPGQDVRVHVIGEQVFAHLISSDESDYRYDKTTQITAYTLPPDIVQMCVATSKGLGFEMAGIDLRLTADGRTFCFEVNPSPAYSYYESRTGQPLTPALCDLLTRDICRS